MELIDVTRHLLQTDADVRYIHVASKTKQPHDGKSTTVYNEQFLADIVRDSLSNNSLDQVFRLFFESNQQTQIDCRRAVETVLNGPNDLKLPKYVLLHCAVFVDDASKFIQYAESEPNALGKTMSYTFDLVGECAPRRLCPLQLMAVMGHTDLMRAARYKLSSSDEFSGANRNDQPDDINPLILAARFNREAFLDEFLSSKMQWKAKETNVNKKKIEVNVEMMHGFTALHIAAIYNHVSIAGKLLKNGSLVNAETKGSIKYPIAFAAAFGHESMVAKLLESMTDVNEEVKKPALVRAVYVAAAMGEDKALILLLKTKLKYKLTDKADTEQYSPFTVALMGNNMTTANLLAGFSGGSMDGDSDEDGYDCPDGAANTTTGCPSGPNSDSRKQRTLVSSKRIRMRPNNTQRRQRETEIHYTPVRQAVGQSGNLSESELLLKYDPTQQMEESWNALLRKCVMEEDTETMEFMFESGLKKYNIKENAKSQFKQTKQVKQTEKVKQTDDSHEDERNSFLHLAARENKVKVLERFSSGKWSVLADKENANGDVPLTMAIRYGNAEAVKCLLKTCSSATLSRRYVHSRTALHLAAIHHIQETIVGYVVEAMNRMTLFDLMDAEDDDHLTALHYAVLLRHYPRECNCIGALVLLEPGPVGAKTKFSALHLASEVSDLEVLESVLKTFYATSDKHDINELNGDDRTALMICAERGDVDGFRLLLEYDAKIDTCNKECEQNVLHLMVRQSVDSPDKVSSFVEMFRLVTNHFRGAVFDVKSKVLQLGHTIQRYPHHEYCETLSQLVSLLTRPNKDASSSTKSNAETMDEVNKLNVKQKPNKLASQSTKPNTTAMNEVKTLTVLQLAASVGASELFQEIVEITNSTETRDTHPGTPVNEEKTNTGLIETKSKWRPDNIIPVSFYESIDPKKSTSVSCIELITLKCNAAQFEKMTSIEPIKSLVKNLSYGSFVIGFVLVAVHVLYMSCLSVYAIQTCHNYTSKPIEQSDIGHNPEPYWYCTFLVYPLFKFNAMIISIRTLCASKSYLTPLFAKDASCLNSHVKFSLLSTALSLLFIVMVVVWYVHYMLLILQHGIAFTTYARTVAIVLLVGWSYTIELMRRLPMFQAFAKYFKLIFVRDIMRIICIYMVLLTGFGLAIHVCILVESSEAENVVDTLFETFGAMFGSPDIFGANADNRQLNRLNNGSLSGFFRGLLAMYALTSTIVLINVLIAMINQSYESVYKESQTMWKFETCLTFIRLTNMSSQKTSFWHRLWHDVVKRFYSFFIYWSLSPVFDHRRTSANAKNNDINFLSDGTSHAASNESVSTAESFITTEEEIIRRDRSVESAESSL